MGLAGTKNRRKIAKDPNNTKWSKNTDTFGQKILRSHGWAPGDYLGVKDAAHAEFHTAANSSHIRVALKDDNLGIGAKRNQGDECTGLAVFKDLLGRLNGKSEAVIEEKKKAREDVKMHWYIEQKYGRMRFVSGGLLVGDQVQNLLDKDNEVDKLASEPESASSDAAAETKLRKEKKSKKRKAERGGEGGDSDVRAEKEKKRRKSSKSESAGVQDLAKDAGPEEDGVLKQGLSESKSKKEKRERKEKKKERKEKKEKKRRKAREADAEEEISVEGESITEGDGRREEEEDSVPASEAEPSNNMSNRHLARRRFIAQKRRAHMDQQALNQIFMIKA